MSSCVVEISEGKVKGKICESSTNVQFVAFKGVPYAKPPIGDLRFSMPVLPESWEGVRDTTQECNICAQFDRAKQIVIGSEDCLYLNVYTPKLSSEVSKPFPVMVFFHGGGFAFGNATDQTQFGPDFLIEKDVVVVMPNYRLGILGFLSLDCKEAPGNMGLRDQVEVLKWIQRNISKFNGDPNNVTIFGVSAGGASVEYLMISPLAKGLFHKAIAQSGSSLLPWATIESETSKEIAIQIACVKEKSDDVDLLQFLKNLPISDLISTTMSVLANRKLKGGIQTGFVPTVEKSRDWEPFLDRKTYSLLQKGEFTKVPFISGFCRREGLLMLTHAAAKVKCLVEEKELANYLPFILSDEKAIDMEKRLKNIYLVDAQSHADDFALDILGDVDFIGGIYTASVLISKNNFPTYLYEFDYDGGLNSFKKLMGINREGPCHGDDVGYLIKTLLYNEENTAKDILVRDRMVTLWTNFAIYGNPTPNINNVINVEWEPITSNNIPYLHISGEAKMSMRRNPYPKRMKIFEELYEKCHN